MRSRTNSLPRERWRATWSSPPPRLTASSRRRSSAASARWLKGGFVVGGSYGKGVATCRTSSGAWSAPATFRMEGGSFGLQIGGEAVDLVLIIMNDQGMERLLSSKFKLGADASAAAGPVGRHVEGTTDWKLRAQVLTYSRSRGVFAGLTVNGSTIRQDKDDTRALYMGANGLVALGDYERGLEWANQAVVIDGHDPMVLYNVACIQSLAGRYDEALADVAIVPRVPSGLVSVWAQYTIRVPAGRRDALAAALRAEGVPTAIYYPIPLHRQQAYKQYPIGEGGVAVSNRLAAEVISLPMHAYLDAPTQDRIIDAVRRALRA